METTINQINRLPYEILVMILREFVNQINARNDSSRKWSDTEKLQKKPSMRDLINLRLVSKRWSKTVLSIYFESITIDSSERARLILDHWNEDFFGLEDHCPVKTLKIKGLWYPYEPDEGEQVEGLRVLKKRLSLVSIEQLTSLIELLGKNLTSLKITFYKYAGLSNRFIKVSQPILKSLKSLKLSVHRRPDFEYSNLTSITHFLHNLPQLESLTLFSVLFDSSVIIGFGSQESKPISLTNLQHFSFVLFETNYELISQFTKSSKNTLKTIRLLSCSSSDEAIEKVLSPIKDTLEGIFTSSFTDEIIGKVIQWSFPNLRVIGTHHHPRWICEKLHWLQVEMLRYVRTIVIDLDGGEEYWSESFSVMEPDVLKNVPNLKLIVFCDRYEESEVHFIDPDLVESFREHGIQCHLIDKLVPDEIMELDYKLNGPMLK